MSRTFLIGDTHGFDSDFRKFRDFSKQNKDLTKDDVVIQLGDSGWIWYPIGSNKEQEYWCNYIANKKFTTLVVLGNHENYDEISTLPECEMFGGIVQYYESLGRFGTDRIYFAKRGEVYTINGKTFWAFGGATSTDKAHRTIGVSWWEGEVPSWAEYEYGMQSLDNVNWDVDYVLSHTLPNSVIGDVIHRTEDTEQKFKCSVAQYLQEVYLKLNFKEWFSGHFHTDVFVDYSDTNDGKFRVLYNKIHELR